MAKWYHSEYIQMTPLLLLFVIPAFSAFLGVRYGQLRSAINFQQGTLGSSPWRCALSMSLVSLPPFCLWCLICGGGSAIFYLLGSFLSLIIVSLTTANILHYIPSPSIFMYLRQRFQSESLQRCTAGIQVFISLTSLFLLLMFTSSFMQSITKFPFYLIAPSIASFALLSVVFTGQTVVMLPVFYAVIAALSAGSGIFVYFGLEEVTSFHDILSFEFSLQKCVSSLVVGVVMGFYQLAASPVMYQIYFSLSTRHKLRLCFTFYGVFQMFFSSFVFIITSLFTHFLENHCKLQYSTSSLFQFIKYTVPHSPLLSYSVAMSFTLLLMFTFQWWMVSLVSTIWEEFVKDRFKEWSAVRQLCALQAAILKLTIGLMLAALAVGFSPFSYSNYLPLMFYIIIALGSILSVTFVCGYYIPCSNYKGNLTALAIVLLFSATIVVLNVHTNPLPRIQNNCTVLAEPMADSLSIEESERMSMLQTFPLEFLPLLIITIYLFFSLLVSALTGWQDLFAMDWNLIVWPCCMSTSLSAKAYRKRRPFVESDSFRYAQNAPLPEVHKVRQPSED